MKAQFNSSQRMIQASKLKCDKYQRDEVSKTNTQRTAKNFDPIAFVNLVVGERSDGSLWVVDGRQRMLGGMEAGIDSFPCLVFKSNGPAHEAAVFDRINTGRTRVSAASRFNARVMAGSEPEAGIAAWLGTLGLTVSKHGHLRNCIDFADTLVRWWVADKQATQKAILIQREIVGDVPLHGQAHKGIYWLLHNGIDVESHVDQLKRLGGLASILRSIKTVQIETGKSAGERVCALGVLRLMNHRKRRRIEMPDEA